MNFISSFENNKEGRQLGFLFFNKKIIEKEKEMKKNQAMQVVVMAVLFLLSSCVPIQTSVQGPNIDYSAQRYVVADPTHFNIGNDFVVRDLRITEYKGRPQFTVSGDYGYEFFGWKTSGKEMADDIYGKIIPAVVKKLGETYRGRNFDIDFDFSIMVRTKVLLDKDSAFKERFNAATNRAPYRAARDVTVIQYSVKREVAFKYSNFDIDSTTLRNNMEIIVGGERIR